MLPADPRPARGPSQDAGAITGWGQPDDRRKSAEAGFVQHLVKPVDPEALAHLVGKLSATSV